MSCSTAEIPRPSRWSVPFSSVMSDHDVERLLSTDPFAKIDRDRFRKPLTLPAILKNDARIVRYRPGEVIIEEGQWGNTAFLLLTGTVRVVVNRNSGSRVSSDSKPRRPQKLWRSIARLWSQPTHPEVRPDSSYTGDGGDQSNGHPKPSICVQDVPAVLNEDRTVVLQPGELFGELAALGRFQRSATVFAETAAELVETRWQGLRDILRRDDRLRARLDQLFRERALASFLRRCPLFQALSDGQLAELSGDTELRTFGRYDRVGSLKRLATAGTASDLSNEPLIAEEGAYLQGLILIRSGLARVSQACHTSHRTVGYLASGAEFALPEVARQCLTKRPVALEHSLRAIGFVCAVIVPLQSMSKWVDVETLRQIVQADENHRNHSSDQSTHAANSLVESELLEFVVANRVHNGTATMVIDLDCCTRCDDCVRACAAVKHNNPRFRRQGLVHERLMFTQACMQCEDPVCMIECPTGAIHRNPTDGRASINEPTCAGCSACSTNCPYDAIQMVQIRNANGQLIRESATQAPIQKATKCDLCFDQLGGPACQTACSYDALARVDMRDISNLKKWLQR